MLPYVKNLELCVTVYLYDYSIYLIENQYFSLLKDYFLAFPDYRRMTINLSHDVAVNQWVTSCHKNHMTTRVVILWRVHVPSFTATMRFLIEIVFILKAIKFHSKVSYDKQNLTLVIISYQMTTRVRSSMSPKLLFLLYHGF